MKNRVNKTKEKRYRRFFGNAKKFGMFKAVVYDGKNNVEYLYPGAKMDSWKAELIVLVVLVVCLVFVTRINFVKNTNYPFKLKDYRIRQRIDKYGMSNLQRAVINDKKKALLNLLKYGADINIRDSWGWTPLHWAKFLGRTDLEKVLTKHGASTESRTTKSWYRIESGLRADLITPLNSENQSLQR